MAKSDVNHLKNIPMTIHQIPCFAFLARSKKAIRPVDVGLVKLNFFATVGAFIVLERRQAR